MFICNKANCIFRLCRLHAAAYAFVLFVALILTYNDLQLTPNITKAVYEFLVTNGIINGIYDRMLVSSSHVSVRFSLFTFYGSRCVSQVKIV